MLEPIPDIEYLICLIIVVPELRAKAFADLDKDSGLFLSCEDLNNEDDGQLCPDRVEAKYVIEIS